MEQTGPQTAHQLVDVDVALQRAGVVEAEPRLGEQPCLANLSPPVSVQMFLV